jgi:hypothetical protein
MIAFSGVWDARLQRKVVAFIGLMTLFGIAYIGALASGFPILIRFFL